MNNYSAGTIWPNLPLTEVQVEALEQTDWVDEEGGVELSPAEQLILQWQKEVGLDVYGTGITATKAGDGTYCLYAENGLEINAELVLQQILRGLPEEYACITYHGATWGDKHRDGVFSGHAYCITRNDIKFLDTHSWLQERVYEARSAHERGK